MTHCCGTSRTCGAPSSHLLPYAGPFSDFTIEALELAYYLSDWLCHAPVPPLPPYIHVCHAVHLSFHIIIVLFSLQSVTIALRGLSDVKKRRFLKTEKVQVMFSLETDSIHFKIQFERV